MARPRKNPEAQAPAEATKKVRTTPFMNASRIIRQAKTMTTEQYEKLAELCLQRIEDVKQTEIQELKAKKAEIEAKIQKLEGKKSQ